MAGVCEREFMERRPGDELLILTRCHSCEVPQVYEALEGYSPSMNKRITFILSYLLY